MNVITWLGFELTYYKVAVQHISHYTKEDPLNCDLINIVKNKVYI